MSLTIQLPARADQTSFNLKRWAEILENPYFREFKGRLESNRHGEAILMPSANARHSKIQAAIALLLQTCLKGGDVLVGCPISTADGVKACDVAWTEDAAVCNDVCRRAPEICVEVRPVERSNEEMNERLLLYFDAGAKEVWVCDSSLSMKFYDAPQSEPRSASKLCSLFPTEIQVR
jgi:hypothetical protein